MASRDNRPSEADCRTEPRISSGAGLHLADRSLIHQVEGGKASSAMEEAHQDGRKEEVMYTWH
jgi:hypothetical protein